MNLSKVLSCPKCNGNEFHIERKVTYVYTYKVNSNNIERNKDDNDVLPFLFDNRKKSHSNESIICEGCGGIYPIKLDNRSQHVDFTILQKAIRSDHTENPQFLG